MRRQAQIAAGCKNIRLRALLLCVLSSFFLLFTFSCGKRDSYYLDSEVTNQAVNELHLSPNNADDMYYRLIKPELQLYKANVAFNEWMPLLSDEVIELTCAEKGSYTIHLQIAKFSKTPSEDLSLSSSDEVIIDEILSWDYVPSAEQIDEIEKINDALDNIVDSNQEEKPKEEEPTNEEPKGIELPEEVETIEEVVFKSLYWSKKEEITLPVFEEKLDPSKKYEVTVYGSLTGKFIDKWIDYKDGGIELDATLNSGRGSKWVWIKYREKGTEEVLEKFTKTTPVYLDPILEFSGAGSPITVLPPEQLYHGIVTAVSLKGCEEKYELVPLTSEGYLCNPTSGYTGLVMTILFEDGQTLILEYKESI